MVTLNFISFHNYASFYIELIVYAQPYSEIYNVKVKDYIESYFSKHFAILFTPLRSRQQFLGPFYCGSSPSRVIAVIAVKKLSGCFRLWCFQKLKMFSVFMAKCFPCFLCYLLFFCLH